MWKEGIKVWISALSHMALPWSWAGHLNFCIQNYPGDYKGNKLLQCPSCTKLLPLLWIKMVTLQVLQHFWAFRKELQMLDSCEDTSQGTSGAAPSRRMSRSQKRAQSTGCALTSSITPQSLSKENVMGTRDSLAHLGHRPGGQGTLLRALKAYSCPWGHDNTQVCEFQKWDELNSGNLVQFALYQHKGKLAQLPGCPGDSQ